MTSLIKFELGKILRNRTVFGGIVVASLVLDSVQAAIHSMFFAIFQFAGIALGIVIPDLVIPFELGQQISSPAQSVQ